MLGSVPASKAASDHLVRAWGETYGLPVVLTNCSNNYGPYHFPEKLIPVVILNALAGKPIPVYGRGENVRDWLYVEDHARGLIESQNAEAGSTLLFGARCERTNLDLVEAICSILDHKRPANHPYADQLRFVTDRRGHDRRYAIDATKISKELGWRPRHGFEEALAETVDWYLNHLEWVESVRSGEYRTWIEQNYGKRQG